MRFSENDEFFSEKLIPYNFMNGSGIEKKKQYYSLMKYVFSFVPDSLTILYLH